MRSFLLESNDELSLKTLEFIKRHWAREDINSIYLKKQIFFYDHPEFIKISPYAIKTDNFIFINNNYFNDLARCSILDSHIEKYNNSFENDLKKLTRRIFTQLDNVQFIQNICLNEMNNSVLNFECFSIKNPVVKMSDSDFLRQTLDQKLEYTYNALIKCLEESPEINEHSPLDLPLKHKLYLSQFKKTIFPNFIHNYNKMILNEGKEGANQFADIFCSVTGSEISGFSNLAFSAFVSHFSIQNIETEYNITLKTDDITRMAAAINTSTHTNNYKRKILIEEVLDDSDVNFIIFLKNNYYKDTPKKKM